MPRQGLRRGTLQMQSPPHWRAFLFPARGFREPLIKSHEGATLAFRDEMREARRSEWLTPLRKPSDKAEIARKGAPDSVSRSVVREGAQAAARNTVKRGAHAAAPAPQASLTVSRQPSRPGCGKIRRLRRCAPWLRSPGYDLRRAPRIHPHFASNAICVGLNQRFLKARPRCP